MEKKKKIIFGALILPLFLLLFSSIAYAELTPPLPGASNYINKDIEEAHQMLTENPEQIILLDVRTEGEYNAEYIPGAINIPLSDLENRLGELDKSKMIIVYCKSDSRSITASETLAQHGFIVYNMEGGINAWKEKFATSIATPIPAETTAPSPTVSPAFTPVASPSPSIPGFEAPLAIMMLLILLMLLRRKRS